MLWLVKKTEPVDSNNFSTTEERKKRRKREKWKKMYTATHSCFLLSTGKFVATI
jgi:hypothetical protein